MKIDYINYGKIRVGDKEYSESVVISSEGLIFNWKEKKKIDEKSMEMLLKQNPEVLIIGKSKSFTEVTPEAKGLLKGKEIILIEDDLSEAINCFNRGTKIYESVLAVFVIEDTS